MKQYERVRLDVVYLQEEDIVTASALTEEMTFEDVWGDTIGGMW